MKPKLIHIVAMDQKRCIGIGDNLPWHLPSDLEWFKAQTTGKTSIVGRKTFDSLPKSVQNDVKRTFIVCSRGPQGNDLTDVCNFPLPHPTTSQEVMTIIGGVGALIRFLVKHYLYELKPNGGGSMNDRITRLEQRLDDIYKFLLEK